METIIITAANADYFELVQGTILSIREKTQGANAIIGFFDLGCTPEQLEWLQGKVNIIKQPDWEFNFPGKDEATVHFKGLLARPFLRKYFPNFDIYLWIDADAWVQDWKAIDLFVQGAKRGGLAIVPEIDRGSEIQYGGLRKFWWQWVYNKYQEAFGEEVAENLYSYPVLNAGVFALHKDAPHWEVWAEYLNQGLQQSVSLMKAQFAINLSVYQGGLFDKTEMLPAWCNWNCQHAFPSWEQEKSCFVEPYLPHTPIGILHLSGPVKEKQIQLKTTDGYMVEVKLLYQVTDQLSPKQKPALNPCYELMPKGSRSSAQQIIPLLIELLQPFPPNTVVDLGCGLGNWLAVFKEFGIEDCLGIDGEYLDPNLLQIPLSQFTSHDLKQPLPIEKKFDLAICLEVAEYLPSECGEQLINSLTQLAPVILFSAAIPFQAGFHLNEQWPQYWVNLFQKNGYAVVDVLRKKIWSNEKVEPWYAQNIFIFVKQDCLSRYPELEKAYQNTNISQLAIVHPRIYLYSLSTNQPNVFDRLPLPPINVFVEPEKQPLVSVVIPCYNQAKFLPESVASIVAQTYENWEIIIVNDGSPDNTSEVARNLIAIYPDKSIRLIEKVNGGVASARNAGIAAATGEYIMPLDADDTLSSNALDYLMNISLKSEVPCVAFASHRVFGIDHTMLRHSYDMYSAENIKKFNMLHPSALYHKVVWDLVKGYKENMIVQGYEDWEFWINCHRQNIPFLGTREFLINYRRTEGSMISNATKKHQQLLAEIICYNREIFDDETIKAAEEILEAEQIKLAAAPTCE
ncbi:glycosyltransferase [Microseira wollei]|uniref:Macrocin-O-methyltransferase domain protein n=1 Tax=Microseira wollei NIES-4236 TaxID=2530354 RepID=A0AAV3XI17_9CYAN|nr:glycosyltransferase [Microseira wollei]GET42079.1 macrocin-O-methyltransferase domain protein [Microseira wollei NIES-4236]